MIHLLTYSVEDVSVLCRLLFWEIHVILKEEQVLEDVCTILYTR